MSIFLCASWFKRGEFWKHPRRGSIVWSSGARFPFAPAAVFWGVLRLLNACAGCKPAEERQDVDTGVELETSCCVADDSRNTLTWQALRLSLISTWLVWEPTHMYTWREEQLVCDHIDTYTSPPPTHTHVQISVTSLPLSSSMMSSSAKSSWQKSEHFSETEK